MPVSIVPGVLRQFVKRKKGERARGKAIDKNVRNIQRRHALGYRSQNKAKDPEDQRRCIEAQILNGHIPEGMTPEDAFTFLNPDLHEEDTNG